MNWNNGYTASYKACVVDSNTWRDVSQFEILGGSIHKTDSNLIESATLECDIDSDAEMWVRVWIDTVQNGASEHVPMFTGLAISPQKNINGNIINRELECYSVLKPAEDVLLPRGFYASRGVSGAKQIRDLLSIIPAPVYVEGESPPLDDYIIAEDGESHLTMAYKILKAIGWRFRINGYGEVTICEQATEDSAQYDTIENDSIEPQISIENDWYDCPNVFRAVKDEVSATARDDSEESPLSTVNRGREIWLEETNCNLNQNESLAEYAQRRLAEEQQRVVNVDYTRRYNPDVTVGDRVYLHYPKQGITGSYQVVAQTTKLGYSAETSEEVIQP